MVAAGDDVDDPADGVRAVQGRVAAPHHLDAVDTFDRQGGEIYLPGLRIVQALTVQHHQHLLGARAADGNGLGITGTAVVLEINTLYILQSFS